MTPGTIQDLADGLAIQRRGIVDRHENASVVYPLLIVASVFIADAVLSEQAA